MTLSLNKQELKSDLTSTESKLNERIDITRLGLVEKTVEESTTIRGRVDITKELINSLRNDVESTKNQIQKVISSLSLNFL